MSDITLTYTSDGQIQTFYADSVYYGVKFITDQPLPRGWKIQIKVIKDK
jgi:hypothetical protein